jgi:hypothetical protein
MRYSPKTFDRVLRTALLLCDSAIDSVRVSGVWGTGAVVRVMGSLLAMLGDEKEGERQDYVQTVLRREVEFHPVICSIIFSTAAVATGHHGAYV